MYNSNYISTCMYMYVCICIYIYIERERERDLMSTLKETTENGSGGAKRRWLN